MEDLKYNAVREYHYKFGITEINPIIFLLQMKKGLDKSYVFVSRDGNDKELKLIQLAKEFIPYINKVEKIIMISSIWLSIKEEEEDLIIPSKDPDKKDCIVYCTYYPEHAEYVIFEVDEYKKVKEKPINTFDEIASKLNLSLGMRTLIGTLFPDYNPINSKSTNIDTIFELFNLFNILKER